MFKNAMEVFALLDKSNCKKCGEKTCLAFAGAVFTGRKDIDQCPVLSEEQKAELRKNSSTQASFDEVRELIKGVSHKLQKLDFYKAAQRCGGEVKQNHLSIQVMGKKFAIDKNGHFSTDLHVNSWLVAPFLTYILDGAGISPKESWISLRELKGGRERYPLFAKRTEEDLRKVGDNYPDLLDDMVQLFGGKEVERQFKSDISVVLLPFPKVPIMLCYWHPEGDIGSTLNFYFDSTVDANIGIDGAYFLCAGLTTMLSKLASQHGGIG